MRKIAILLLITSFATGAFAQSTYREYETDDPMDQLPDEFYFTKGMVNWMVTEFTNKLGEQLDMDQEQLELTRENFRESLPRWFADQRKDLQPVMNDFLTMWAKNESPTPEQVSEWAERAVPAFDSFTEMMTETSEATRGYLTEEQNVTLDGNLAAFRVGTGYARARLEEWSEGGFDPEVHWHRAPGHAEIARDEAKMIQEEERYAREIAEGKDAKPPAHWDAGDSSSGNAAGGSTGPVAGSQFEGNRGNTPTAQAKKVNDEWANYTENFCRKYDFDDGQRAKAFQFLADAQEQRDRWQNKIANRLKRLESLAARATTESGKAAAKQKIQKLQAPFERHFDRLKQRLEKLPTAKQRANAAAAPAAAAATGKR